MSTYAEIFNLNADTSLRNRIAVAVGIKATEILDLQAPTSNQLEWANGALKDPPRIADALLRYVVATNKELTPEQIAATSDSVIQTTIDAAIDVLIAGGIVS